MERPQYVPCRLANVRCLRGIGTRIRIRRFRSSGYGSLGQWHFLEVYSFYADPGPAPLPSMAAWWLLCLRLPKHMLCSTRTSRGNRNLAAGYFVLDDVLGTAPAKSTQSRSTHAIQGKLVPKQA